MHVNKKKNIVYINIMHIPSLPSSPPSYTIIIRPHGYSIAIAQRSNARAHHKNARHENTPNPSRKQQTFPHMYCVTLFKKLAKTRVRLCIYIFIHPFHI